MAGRLAHVGIDVAHVHGGPLREDADPARAERAGHFPALKIKLGGPRDLATLEAVRKVFAGPIRVDANTGWTRDDAVAILPELEKPLGQGGAGRFRLETPKP